MATTIYATFREVSVAERAAGALLDYGVRPEDLTLIQRQSVPSEDLRHPDEPASRTGENDRFGGDAVGVTDEGEDEAYASGSVRSTAEYYDNLAAYDEPVQHDPENAAKSGITPTTPADAGAGAVKGAGMGLGIGALAALASIFVPGVGLVTGAGALATALAGMAATAGAGAIAGGVTGYLKEQGMDSRLAEDYGEAIGEGGALLSVTVPSAHVDVATARSILEKYGAGAVNAIGVNRSGGYAA